MIRVNNHTEGYKYYIIIQSVKVSIHNESLMLSSKEFLPTLQKEIIWDNGWSPM